MRTIKFKGTCIGLRYCGNIAFGSLVAYPDGTTRIFEYGQDGSFNNYRVGPDTVCQFTGFLDKNGKEIYEGDVLRSDEYPYSCIGDNRRDNYYAVVYYCEEGACFGIVMVKNPNSSVAGISDGILDDVEREKMQDFEVIGNVHDLEWKQYREYIQDEDEE